MSATVTPSNTNNKILVIVDIKGCAQNSQIGAIATIEKTVQQYILETLLDVELKLVSLDYMIVVSPTNALGAGMLCYLDSPSTTSAVTYKLQTRTLSASVHIK
jgi:hypothetical protein